MKRRGPIVEFNKLREFAEEAESKFLAHHLTAPMLGTPSKDEVLDVAAFVVLIHGAFENFAEGVGLWALESIERSWTLKKRVSRCSASLLLYHNSAQNDWEIGRSVYDNIRVAIGEAKSATSITIERNNGIAMRHLRALFRPLGIEVPEDPTLVSALELLVALRHEWAHQYRYGAKKVKFAIEVKKTAEDCLVLARMVADSARSVRP